MKKHKLLFLTFLSLGVLSYTSVDSVSASEIDSLAISKNVTVIDDVEIEETIVPNNLVDEWERINSWETGSLTSEVLSENSPVESKPAGEMTIFGAQVPGLTSKWNVKSQGSKAFGGSFRSSNALYTNHYYTGLTRYRVKVQSFDGKAGFQAKSRLKTYRTSTLDNFGTHYLTITTPSTGTDFYLKFYPITNPLTGGSVSGTISSQ